MLLSPSNVFSSGCPLTGIALHIHYRPVLLWYVWQLLIGKIIRNSDTTARLSGITFILQCKSSANVSYTMCTCSAAREEQRSGELCEHLAHHQIPPDAWQRVCPWESIPPPAQHHTRTYVRVLFWLIITTTKPPYTKPLTDLVNATVTEIMESCTHCHYN